VHLVVTGGAGFIGSHIVDAFVVRGWRVTVIDNLSTGDRANVNREATFIERDLRDPAVVELISELKPDVVDHHAAQVDVRKSVADPAADAEDNVVASVRLMQASAAAGVKRFVFASSGGAIYGEPEYAPQDEDHPTRPMSPYGCAKLAVENYMEYFNAALGLSSVSLRYANVYGPRQRSIGEAGVVAIVIDRRRRGETFTINGDGEQTRDFVYIDDVVAANVAVIDDFSIGGAFNVGTGVETSVNALYREVARAAGGSVDVRHGDAKAGEQRRSVIDGRRLRRAAKLREPVALRDGLERAWKAITL
jgi:UDP-glucose 4-epimerase